MTYDIAVDAHGSLPEVETEGLDVDQLHRLIERVLRSELVDPGTGITLLLEADAYLQELNREFRAVDEPTDVLAFGASDGAEFPSADDEPEYLGDIVVSLPLARRQAEAAAIEPVEELHHLVVHGILHLLGYDHEEPMADQEMRSKEEKFLGGRIHASRGADSHVLHS